MRGKGLTGIGSGGQLPKNPVHLVQLVKFKKINGNWLSRFEIIWGNLERGRAMKQRIDIEHLVAWAYRDQMIDRVAGLVEARNSPAKMRSATDVMVSIAALGTRVSSSPRHVVALGARAAADAEAVHGAVLALPAEAMALVICHGRGGSRPHWHGRDAERLVPDTDEAGRVRTVRNLKRTPVMSLLRTVVDMELVHFSRAQYGLWWDALDGLAGALDGQLRDHAPAPPQAMREPWEAPELIYVD
ncbi:hypothetical protein [Pararhodobacter sp.]|uniref:hypothetical protein n=1 Tax=Pararhodobacter sp. TaxID=2127056 RepID=UPI002B000DDC|nr:hypothetical protein [Pararhodobacter sp.]